MRCSSFLLGRIAINRFDKLQPFLMAMKWISHRQHLCGEDIERGEQCHHAVAFVVVGHRGASSALERQVGLRSFQGIARRRHCLAPRLLVDFRERRDCYASAAEVQMNAGIAPVTESSGKQHWVHWRMQCRTLRRQTFVKWAALTIPIT
jgi:Transposase IS116/IS110/IS902 family